MAIAKQPEEEQVDMVVFKYPAHLHGHPGVQVGFQMETLEKTIIVQMSQTRHSLHLMVGLVVLVVVVHSTQLMEDLAAAAAEMRAVVLLAAAAAAVILVAVAVANLHIFQARVVVAHTIVAQMRLHQHLLIQAMVW